MKCQRSPLFSLMAITVWFSLFSGHVQSGERDDLYELGNEAYESGDYVEALKNLYAFYVLNENEIDGNPDFKKKIANRISHAETTLKLSFSSNPSIQENNGRIRIITRQGSGSFTGTGMEIDDLIKRKEIDLDYIKDLNHESLTSPSSGR